MQKAILYQIHTRVWLHELGVALGRPASLDDVPDDFLDAIAAAGFDWIWWLGIWQTGPKGRSISRAVAELRPEFESQLPDLVEDDICGSPFAVESYTVHRDYGGEAALARLRGRMQERGLKLMLDFVPNHTGPDSPWIAAHPEFFVTGREDDIRRQPNDFKRVKTSRGSVILAHGRDPYFPGWTDTFQVNIRHRGLRDARRDELLHIASRCDGVRCDMAMLLLADVFLRTWGDLSQPADGSHPIDASFWAELIPAVRVHFPDFQFLAEAYWDREWDLQQEGFDATYDKRLYDRLHALDAVGVSRHLLADADYQRRSLRFLENHDEPRAAAAFPEAVHLAAAVITYLTPGPHLFYEGQFEGRTIRPSVHLRRRRAEPSDELLKSFYRELLLLAVEIDRENGHFTLLPRRAAWDANSTWEQFITFAWEHDDGRRLLIVVNYGPTAGQSYVMIPWEDLGGRMIRLEDRIGPARYDRQGDDLRRRGLYLDLPAWGYHAFDITAI